MIYLFTHTDLDGVGCAILTKLFFADELCITYCDYGDISADVCRKLAMQGYRAISIVGGYKNYLLRR